MCLCVCVCFCVNVNTKFIGILIYDLIGPMRYTPNVEIESHAQAQRAHDHHVAYSNFCFSLTMHHRRIAFILCSCASHCKSLYLCVSVMFFDSVICSACASICVYKEGICIHIMCKYMHRYRNRVMLFAGEKENL